MKITLTRALRRYVKDKLATGLYADASDVVSEALRLLHREDDLNRLRREKLLDELGAGPLAEEDVIDLDEGEER